MNTRSTTAGIEGKSQLKRREAAGIYSVDYSSNRRDANLNLTKSRGSVAGVPLMIVAAKVLEVERTT